ncbi:MAG: PQQ-dependent sugar dehydrogenase, partial [Actinomycetota bacterium]|nr:PQQ-dependent sugar dehydrogenase [Actinomycetota bacterium]
MRRRSTLSLPLILGMLLTIALPLPAIAAAPSLNGVVVQNGLVNPWDVAFAPGGQMFVTERPGRVRVFRSGNRNADLLATTTISNVRAEGEAGVMGIAVDPNFEENRLVYVCASRDTSVGWRNQVLRYRVGNGWKLQFDRYVIRNGMRANTIHNGCAVEFGPDGRLWVTMGDAAVESRAQDPNSLNGKVLRVNRTGSIPNDNPIMDGASQRTAVYSMGHRNPQGIAFQPSTGLVFAVEHGPDRSDEINRIRPGRNYGWPCVTGNNNPYHGGTAGCATNGPFVTPAWHSGSSTIATSGAAFVRGANWGSFRDQLFVAQLKQSDLRRFKLVSEATADYRATYFDGRWGRLRGV